MAYQATASTFDCTLRCHSVGKKSLKEIQINKNGLVDLSVRSLIKRFLTYSTIIFFKKSIKKGRRQLCKSIYKMEEQGREI